MRWKLLMIASLLLIWGFTNAQNPFQRTATVPTDSDIAKDLIGRKITEGKENGYFGSDWKWTIETGEESNTNQALNWQRSSAKSCAKKSVSIPQTFLDLSKRFLRARRKT